MSMIGVTVSSHVNTPSEECVKSSSLKHRATGVSSILAVVLAVAALFMYNHYKRKQQPALLSKENWRTDTKQHQEKEEEEYSQSWQTEVDGIPSEMSSSFQRGASYTSSSKKGGADEAAVSSERRKARKINNKRESLASSSDFSPSYGSFTTYEKIHIKHGNEEDEIITPRCKNMAEKLDVPNFRVRLCVALSSMRTRSCCVNGIFNHLMVFGHFLLVSWRSMSPLLKEQFAKHGRRLMQKSKSSLHLLCWTSLLLDILTSYSWQS